MHVALPSAPNTVDWVPTTTRDKTPRPHYLVHENMVGFGHPCDDISDLVTLLVNDNVTGGTCEVQAFQV